MTLAGIMMCLLTSGLALVFLSTGWEKSFPLVEPVLLLAGGGAIVAGTICMLVDLFALLPSKRQDRLVAFDHLPNRLLTVTLTAYNDELSIGESVKDFRMHPLVKRVIVIDNNSKDRTSQVASEAGAIVVVEKQPGYGKCVFRALQEGL
ncbi:MAG TPA: glycosyltransferase, partial [Bryobacteraceae bacterium]|nr:glycosyltransferase [Bryobacteraceae bacterium]